MDLMYYLQPLILILVLHMLIIVYIYRFINKNGK